MPEIIGENNTHRPEFVVKESDFISTELKIKGVKIKGRSVHEFFLTDKEFERIMPSVCFDGVSKNPIIQLDDGEPILTAGSQTETYISLEYYQEMKGGKFIVGGNLWMKDKLKELGIPVREIKLWHIFGWSFKN